MGACGGGRERRYFVSAKHFTDGIKLVYSVRNLNGARISIHNTKEKKSYQRCIKHWCFSFLFGRLFFFYLRFAIPQVVIKFENAS